MGSGLFKVYDLHGEVVLYRMNTYTEKKIITVAELKNLTNRFFY